MKCSRGECDKPAVYRWQYREVDGTATYADANGTPVCWRHIPAEPDRRDHHWGVTPKYRLTRIEGVQCAPVREHRTAIKVCSICGGEWDTDDNAARGHCGVCGFEVVR